MDHGTTHNYSVSKIAVHIKNKYKTMVHKMSNVESSIWHQFLLIVFSFCIVLSVMYQIQRRRHGLVVKTLDLHPANMASSPSVIHTIHQQQHPDRTAPMYQKVILQVGK